MIGGSSSLSSWPPRRRRLLPARRTQGLGRGPRRRSSPAPVPPLSLPMVDGPAGKGTGPLSFEQRFVDRAALPKGVTFDHLADIPSVSIDSGTSPGRVVRDDDAAMHDDAEDPAGDGLDDDDAVPSGAVAPIWPPADASLAQFEDWQETIRRLPADVIYAREGVLENRTAELRRPKPKGQASPPRPRPEGEAGNGEAPLAIAALRCLA